VVRGKRAMKERVRGAQRVFEGYDAIKEQARVSLLCAPNSGTKLKVSKSPLLVIIPKGTFM